MNWADKCEVYQAVEKIVFRFCDDPWRGLDKAFFLGDPGNPAKLAREVIIFILNGSEGKNVKKGV
jgi:hypothetical protein